MPAGEFKAKCLALLDEVSITGEELIVTKRGKPVAKSDGGGDCGASDPNRQCSVGERHRFPRGRRLSVLPGSTRIGLSVLPDQFLTGGVSSGKSSGPG